MMNNLLLVLHLLGLCLGMTVPFSNLVMARLIDAATPPERATLWRFPFAVSRVGETGLVLLWITGPILVFTKYTGFGSLPGLFHAKLAAVVLLTLGVGGIHMNKRKALAGDSAAMNRIQTIAKFNLLCALAAIVLAVFTFEH